MLQFILTLSIGKVMFKKSHQELRRPAITSKRMMMALIFILAAPFSQANDSDDVLKVVQRWADLETNLEAQAQLIRDDRVQITGGIRQSNQAENLKVQIASFNAMVKNDGGTPTMIVRIESPLVKIYGNTAVVSFIRLDNGIPHNQGPRPANAAWATMVLVKEGGDWKIAHHHMSPFGG